MILPMNILEELLHNYPCLTSRDAKARPIITFEVSKLGSGEGYFAASRLTAASEYILKARHTDHL